MSSLTLLLLFWILLDSAPEVPRGRPSRQRDPLDSSSDRGRPLYPSPPTRDPEHEVQPFTTVPPVNGPDHRYLPGGPFLPDHLLRREFQGDQRFFSENAAAPLAARTTVPGSRAVPGDAGDGAREAEEVPAFSDVASPATTTPAPTLHRYPGLAFVPGKALTEEPSGRNSTPEKDPAWSGGKGAGNKEPDPQWSPSAPPPSKSLPEDPAEKRKTTAGQQVTKQHVDKDQTTTTTTTTTITTTTTQTGKDSPCS